MFFIVNSINAIFLRVFFSLQQMLKDKVLQSKYISFYISPTLSLFLSISLTLYLSLSLFLSLEIYNSQIFFVSYFQNITRLLLYYYLTIIQLLQKLFLNYYKTKDCQTIITDKYMYFIINFYKTKDCQTIIIDKYIYFIKIL